MESMETTIVRMERMAKTVTMELMAKTVMVFRGHGQHKWQAYTERTWQWGNADGTANTGWLVDVRHDSAHRFRIWFCPVQCINSTAVLQ